MKTLIKFIAICIIIACLTLFVSTVATCILYKLNILHMIIVLSFVTSFSLFVGMIAVDVLKDLYDR